MMHGHSISRHNLQFRAAEPLPALCDDRANARADAVHERIRTECVLVLSAGRSLRGFRPGRQNVADTLMPFHGARVRHSALFLSCHFVRSPCAPGASAGGRGRKPRVGYKGTRQ
jgi:hypothetical protein